MALKLLDQILSQCNGIDAFEFDPISIHEGNQIDQAVAIREIDDDGKFEWKIQGNLLNQFKLAGC